MDVQTYFSNNIFRSCWSVRTVDWTASDYFLDGVNDVQLRFDFNDTVGSHLFQWIQYFLFHTARCPYSYRFLQSDGGG